MKSKKLKQKCKSCKSRKGGYLGDTPFRPWHLSFNKEIALSFLHGSSNGSSIIVPKNINIVTLTPVGVNVPLHRALDEQIRAFINDGNNFFKYNKKKFTPEGDSFNRYLQSKNDSFIIRNHIEGQEMNDMTISFTANMSEYIGTEIYLDSPRINVRSFSDTFVKHGMHFQLPTMTIFDLIRYLCGVDDIKKVERKVEGHLTLILVACRGCDTAPPKYLSMMRQRSAEGDEYKMSQPSAEIDEFSDIKS